MFDVNYEVHKKGNSASLLRAIYTFEHLDPDLKTESNLFKKIFLVHLLYLFFVHAGCVSAVIVFRIVPNGLTYTTQQLEFYHILSHEKQQQ